MGEGEVRVGRIKGLGLRCEVVGTRSLWLVVGRLEMARAVHSAISMNLDESGAMFVKQRRWHLALGRG